MWSLECIVQIFTGKCSWMEEKRWNNSKFPVYYKANDIIKVELMHTCDHGNQTEPLIVSVKLCSAQEFQLLDREFVKHFGNIYSNVCGSKIVRTKCWICLAEHLTCVWNIEASASDWNFHEAARFKSCYVKYTLRSH